MTPSLAADMHCHLDQAGGLPALEPNGAVRVIAVTNLPQHWMALRRLHHPNVTWALGLHPQQRHTRRDLVAFLKAADEATVLGEVGLDGTDGPVPLVQQRQDLEQILNHPAASDRMVSLHSRRAATPMLEHLLAVGLPGAVLHWFTGTSRQAARAADLGAWFSITATMTRKTELVQALPRDRVLLESDAPHGGRGSRPGRLDAALVGLASVWKVTPLQAEDLIVANQEGFVRRLRHNPFPVPLGRPD
jgi:TatD DNase family protein